MNLNSKPNIRLIGGSNHKILFKESQNILNQNDYI
jgi:hypothetical protein